MQEELNGREFGKGEGELYKSSIHIKIHKKLKCMLYILKYVWISDLVMNLEDGSVDKNIHCITVKI